MRWLGQRPVAASPKAMLAEVDKLVFLRDLGVVGWDVSDAVGRTGDVRRSAPNPRDRSAAVAW